jgi:hypothetical protein
MEIETYFGFFAEAVFNAMAGAIASQTGKPVRLDTVAHSTSNTIKLRESAVDSVILPSFAEPVDVNFVLALTARDTAALIGLCGPRRPLHRVMEQAVSTAVEPLNFINKSRNRLTSLQISRNVTGLTAHHLDGAMVYTMAEGRFDGGGQEFSLRLLVSERGRDLIEERAIQPHTQRALFSINEGAYVPSPQWEPPPPPPGADTGRGLSESLMNSWLQTYFAFNDGEVACKLFKRPAVQLCQVISQQSFEQQLEGEEELTFVRLFINGQKELELILLLPAQAVQSLMSLSKSGQDKFLGDFFRAYFAEAAGLWSRFSGEKMSWRVQGVGKLRKGAMQTVTTRLKGGGLAVTQEVRMDEGRVRWFMAMPPHTWRFLLGLAAKAMGSKETGMNAAGMEAAGMEGQDAPEREAVFAATGWGAAALPWQTVVELGADRDLQQAVRLLTQLKMGEAQMAAVVAALDDAARERWLAALPVMLRERTEAFETEEQDAGLYENELTHALIGFNRGGKLQEGKLCDWVRLFTEFTYARRQAVIEKLLPLRHLIYGMDRASLSRLLFDMKNDVLVNLVCGAEFPVIDQMRRAISPGFALRLLEDVAVKRGRTTAYAVQEAQLTLYRTCAKAAGEGRLMLRATPGKRLAELLGWLDQPS